MSTESSPILWAGDTLKIKTSLDKYIALKPAEKEIPIFNRDYQALLKTINARTRHLYENELMYHGRKLVVR